ncbi:hypothetical protein FNF29_00781 [Cafeteria roenbergensis]|uniref:Polyadenylate-binding protein n=1 Tax=Cafeteria roenbergensis TaxID=33653 RepID=A0A5A8CWY7_CAFRO|nr:hypothetical protein FNF29_00781 [Cafeteria roenbergensis]KAA0162729.1 hypothetical protein FNF28_04610 [Cafeteria roenbergensis]|eukprot:KAA0156670.1 hypothetical protein FNF29_00781 [Cafeteria roenbergensis]
MRDEASHSTRFLLVAPKKMAAATIAVGPSAGAAAGGVAAPAAPSTAALWVGDLNVDVTAQDLYETFNATAFVSSLRLCRDQATGKSRGYAYVNFNSVDDAQKAMDTLNYTVFKGRPCRIMWSTRGRSAARNTSANIVIKNLSAKTSPKEVDDAASYFGTIVSCKVPVDSEGNSKGYAFVQFDSAEAAANAIEELNGSENEGSTWTVEPFKSRAERVAEQKWTNVYLKQYPRCWTEAQIRELVETVGPVNSLFVPTDSEGKGRGFCFANFEKSEDAKRAVAELSGKEVANPEHDASDESTGPATLTLMAARAMPKAERQRLVEKESDKKKAEFLRSVEGRNLFVKNLDERVNDEALKEFFAPHGTVSSARVSRDASGRSQLFGYVCFATRAEAEKAMYATNRQVLSGKPLYVAMWQPKNRRAQMLASTYNAPSGFRGAVPAYGAMPPFASAYGSMMQPPVGYAMGRGPNPNFAGAAHGIVPAGYAAHGMIQGAVPRPAAPAQAAAPSLPVGQAAAHPAGAPAPAAAPAAAPADALPSAAALIEMDPVNRQRAIGSRLFPLIAAIDRPRAPKLTGMLLNGLDVSDLLGLLQSPADLKQSVADAQKLLEQGTHVRPTRDAA